MDSPPRFIKHVLGDLFPMKWEDTGKTIPDAKWLPAKPLLYGFGIHYEELLAGCKAGRFEKGFFVSNNNWIEVFKGVPCENEPSLPLADEPVPEKTA